MKKRNYPRVCIMCTVYALFEYMLVSSYKEIVNTYYIIEKCFWKDFGSKFEHSFCLPSIGFGKRGRNVIWIYYYLLKWFKLPSFKRAELFAQDHFPSHAILIGRHDYTLLEDGPYCHSTMLKTNFQFSTYEEQEYKSLSYGKGKLTFQFRKLVYGPVYYNAWGKSDKCTDLILSTDDYVDYFKNKKIHRIKIKGIWNTFSIEKQELLLQLFGMNREDIDLLVSKKIIILTQPLYPDYISKEEHSEIWKKIISKYPINEILVKPHPRDSYNYEDDFKGLAVFRKKVPSQFFDALDLQFNKAVTTFSSSAFGLNATEIDWYGTEVSEALNNKIKSKTIKPEGLKVNFCSL